MTRFEFLGLLPNKRITAYAFQKNTKRLNKLWTTDPITFVDQLPQEFISLTFVARQSQPELGHLLKATWYSPKQRYCVSIYFKPDKRKLKRFAKRFNIKLPKFKPTAAEYPESS